MKAYLMGNEAIALGAIAAGVNSLSGYPGTPSTEVLETVAKRNDGSIYVEWSTNEKAALELAAGCAYSGARSMVTMKQVGLNVAADPLMSLAYIGVKGGMVVMAADDPGPISSQTEQDTRTFAAFSKLPCFDPSTVQEAYDMIQDAFEFSEKYGTPVLFRPTTRVCHGYASIDILEESEYHKNEPEGFIKDTMRWVIFPRTSYLNHIKIEKRNSELRKVLSEYDKNFIVNNTAPSGAASKKGIATHGISYTYVEEAAASLKDAGFPDILKVSTPFPFPEELALSFLKDKEEVLCIEELDPVIERELIYICGKYGLSVRIRGKESGDIDPAGENTRDSVLSAAAKFIGVETGQKSEDGDTPPLPVRPPVLCAGCPHRASFYAVKQAMKGRKAVFCGDIGCYTLGNAQPLDMVDTCLCMGAGVNITQGIGRIEPDTTCFAFVGDSTFFASAITGAVNAVYNRADMILVILDNSTTAMTGHQPHPGTGIRMMDYGKESDIAGRISIENVLRGIGVEEVVTVDPLDLSKATSEVKRLADISGVKAVIFRSPCVAIIKPEGQCRISSEECIGCRKCIREIGCPAIFMKDEKACIDESLCTGCGLCEKICPVGAIK